MKYGLMMFPTDYSISPVDLAVAAEGLGFESLWFPEHSHIPVSRTSPFPAGGELPKMYYDALDPFVALAAAAAATKTLRLATGICLVVQRDPIQTAKEVATLDRISGGRFLFGVGAGWNAEEMANHGTRDFARRFELLRERVLAMKAIWTESKAEYHGELVDFDPIFAWPKPLQKPHPPIHVGGGFPGAARRAIAWGDGWMPVAARGDQDVTKHVPAFRKIAEEAGRDPASLEVSAFAVPAKPETLARYRDAGLSRAIVGLPSGPRNEILPLLEKAAEAARAVG